MAEIRRPRRYYLLKRRRATCDEEWGLVGAWRAKQEAQPGVPLAEDFPLRARLSAHGYTTVEDIDGADECELTELGFSAREAAAILAAVPPQP